MQALIITVAPGKVDDVKSYEVSDWRAAQAVIWAELVQNCGKKWRDDVWKEWNSHDGSAPFHVMRKDGSTAVTYAFRR